MRILQSIVFLMTACQPLTAAPCQTPTGPKFHPAVIRETRASHCFSVCLYREPLFAARFPQRDFAARYLAAMPKVKAFIEEKGFHLNIFADPAMLETAIGFNCGSVYLVTDQPAFPFAQHLYRYYSALLPHHPTIRAYHFRGLDNLLIAADELELLRHFVKVGGEILHAPYLRAAGTVYTPVRGSCSIAGGAIASLGRFLASVPNVQPEDENKSLWHNDEIYLGRWFAKAQQQHRLYTIIDREMPVEFYMALASQVRSGLPFNIARLERSTFTRPSK